jgi:TFIIF-interacting CTD phosphatase-like protein
MIMIEVMNSIISILIITFTIFSLYLQSILVDNSPHAYGYDLDNGIPIESWFDDPSDTELLKLAGFLRGVTDVDDVRPVIKNHFRSFELVHNATLGFATVTTAPPF